MRKGAGLVAAGIGAFGLWLLARKVTGAPEFICPYCGEVFDTYEDLTTHTALHPEEIPLLEPGECMEMIPGPFYYFVYIGPSQVVKKALGECYPVIYTLDVYDEETRDWWPPVDPENDILPTGVRCRVKVQAPCLLCGFA